MSNQDSSGHFRLLYFASAASYTGKTSDNLIAPLPIVELFDTLEKMYPGIGHAVLTSAAVTLNLDYVDIDQEKSSAQDTANPEQAVIRAGDEVAIIPPVSSG